MPQTFEQQLTENRKVLGGIVSVLETFSRVFEKNVKFRSMAHHLIGSMVESMWLKCLTLEKIFVPFGKESKTIPYDPQVMYTIAREVYEWVAVFENICVLPESVDDKTMMYLMFVIKGLREPIIRMEKAGETDNEKYRIMSRDAEEYYKMVKRLPAYLSLDEKSKEVIAKAYQNGEPGTFVKDGNRLTWQKNYPNMYKAVGLKEFYQESVYSTLSLLAHSTYWGARQIQEAFIDQSDKRYYHANQAVKIIIDLLSLMIIDMTTLVPEFHNSIEGTADFDGMKRRAEEMRCKHFKRLQE